MTSASSHLTSLVQKKTYTSLYDLLVMKFQHKPIHATPPRLSLTDLICPYSPHVQQVYQGLDPQTRRRDSIHECPPLQGTHWTTSLDSRPVEAFTICMRAHRHLPLPPLLLPPQPEGKSEIPTSPPPPPSLYSHAAHHANAPSKRHLLRSSPGSASTPKDQLYV